MCSSPAGTRVGNFEVVRYVVGSYDLPAGLLHRPSVALVDAGL
jgi:hypothetical protein